MSYFKITVFSLSLSLVACISGAFAKTPFVDMPAGEYAVDLSHASVAWKVSHLGLSSYVARFADFDAKIDYKPSDITKSTVTAKINPMSIQTAYPNAEQKDFDKILASEKGWFNAGEFASIDFISRSIEMTGEKTAIMQGDLRFLGITKAVSLSVIFNGAMQRQPFSGKPTMGFSATATIKRSDWGMDKYVPSIGDNVEVMIEGEFVKTDS
ncbi:MAG: polyisoprenoid-binding protein YceI [Glaciecola sp.]|jgi:polyisoprenoid-binding protein YceI